MSLAKRSKSDDKFPRERGNHSSMVAFPPNTKCEFCDVSFNCDLDVARHLGSPSHRTKRDEHLSLSNKQDKVVEKNIPKNLKKVFELLKLRSAGDLRDLAEKDYFDTPDDKTSDIARMLVVKLTAAKFKYDSRNLKSQSQKTACAIIKQLETDTQEETVDDRSQETTLNEEDRSREEPVEQSSRKKAKTGKTIHLPRDKNPTKVPVSSTSKMPESQNTSTASTSSESSEQSAPIPALGQNWSYKPQFAIIKTEPKD